MFVFVKRYMKRTASKIVFVGVLSLILSKTSSPFSWKVWKYHQNLTLFHPKVNHERTLNKLRISSWTPGVSGSCQAKNIHIFTNSAPLGRVGHRVAMSVCVSVCLRHRVHFFVGLSLALSWHDQFQASHSPPSLPPLETWKLGTYKLGDPPPNYYFFF